MTISARSPFPKFALPLLWQWMESFRDRVMDDFAPADLPGFIANWEEQETSRRSWGVWRDEEIGGVVVVEPVNPVAVTAHCVFKRSFWGHPVTVPALRLVAQEVFDSGIERISSSIFEDNHQMRTLAMKIGAIEESRRSHPLRNCTRRGGKLVGMRVMAIFPDTFAAALEASQAGDKTKDKPQDTEPAKLAA